MATFKLIAFSTVGSGGASSITFSSIPGTYTDLAILVSAKTNKTPDTASDCVISFNSNTSNYSGTRLYGSGSGASSDSPTNRFAFEAPANSTASTFGNAWIYIPNYAGSANKSYTSDSVTENNATEAYTMLFAGLWTNTSAITSIDLGIAAAGTKFVQYSTAYLYGISNA